MVYNMSQFFGEARVHHPRPQWTRSPNLTSPQLPWFIPCLWSHWIQTELQWPHSLSTLPILLLAVSNSWLHRLSFPWPLLCSFSLVDIPLLNKVITDQFPIKVNCRSRLCCLVVNRSLKQCQNCRKKKHFIVIKIKYDYY